MVTIMFSSQILRPQCTALLILLSLVFLAGNAFAFDKPNIVIMFVDDLSWMDLGTHSEIIDTPNIDRFAEEGVTFKRTYADAPVCSPSRVGMITGQHPARHEFFRHVSAGGEHQFDKFGRTDDAYSYWEGDPAGMPSRNWLPLEVTTVAERLSDSGYHTAFVGKWHLGHEPYHPVKQGFDEQHGVSNYGHPKSYYPPFFSQAMVYEDAPEDAYLTDLVTSDAVKVIERAAESDQPLFLSLWWYNVHNPFVGKKDLVKKYEGRGLEGRNAHLAAMVEAIDQSFSRIEQALDKAGMLENTIVVFTSDQGGYFDHPPIKGKKTGGLALYEGGARVPLFIRWPGQFPQGVAIDRPVSLLDIAPTILIPAGADTSDLDGEDLATMVQNPNRAVRPIVMYRHYEDLYAAVVVDNWKLLVSVSGNHELYDLDDDISESQNLAAENPEKLAELLTVLETWKVEKDIKRFNTVEVSISG